ncbi:hypothetical protein KIK84_01730 [Curvibacter sp. CHRR-16]|uniref:pectinesterase family protein n=1 Tax=Curvibacter sp. CHRR-16 TaxID=2835872 RepID=UPI001BDA29F2|nr:pectinesterase family protein [Curvibacter sp. CHRR-16]MBT0569036.1 hypothetical protein [Curvibacter sp. CHRR-16]
MNMEMSRRTTLAWMGLGTTAAWLQGCASLPSAMPTAHAIVDRHFKGTPGTVVNDVATWTTLQAALEAAPADRTEPWVIYIRNGRYYEKPSIHKPFMALYGESRDKTIITFDASNGADKPGGGKWGTSGSATVTVTASDFSAQNLTIENGFNYPANEAKAPTDPSYNRGPQAVALKTEGQSDRCMLRGVTLLGYQDTVFTDAGRSYFTDCAISGHIDFIFGAGQSFFENCQIICRPRKRKGSEPLGYVTAPSTSLNQAYGLVFFRCKLVKENAQVPANSYALGRPWHPTRTFADGRYADPNAVGSSVFIACFMDDHIMPMGWDAMAGTAKDGSNSAIFKPEDARFWEYKNTGPGAVVNDKRRQLSDNQATDYSQDKVLAGWIAALRP